jgi:hypothetical protein
MRLLQKQEHSFDFLKKTSNYLRGMRLFKTELSQSVLIIIIHGWSIVFHFIKLW